MKPSMWTFMCAILVHIYSLCINASLEVNNSDNFTNVTTAFNQRIKHDSITTWAHRFPERLPFVESMQNDGNINRVIQNDMNNRQFRRNDGNSQKDTINDTYKNIAIEDAMINEASYSQNYHSNPQRASQTNSEIQNARLIRHLLRQSFENDTEVIESQKEQEIQIFHPKTNPHKHAFNDHMMESWHDESSLMRPNKPYFHENPFDVNIPTEDADAFRDHGGYGPKEEREITAGPIKEQKKRKRSASKAPMVAAIVILIIVVIVSASIGGFIYFVRRRPDFAASPPNEWAPEKIKVEQINYKGPLQIAPEQPFITKHELEDEKIASVHDGDHVVFDDTLNEAYEIGKGVEQIIGMAHEKEKTARTPTTSKSKSKKVETKSGSKSLELRQSAGRTIVLKKH